MRREQKLLIGLLLSAVLTLLLFGVGRRPTSPPGEQRRGQQPQQPQQQDESSVLLRTELFTLSRVNASIKHNEVPMRISLLAVLPRGHIQAKVPSVLLLHGHGQSARLWEKTGTLQVLGDIGHRGYAIDLPGSGGTRLQGKLAHSEFLQAVMDYLELDRPLLVAPSTSGAFAFDFIFEDPSSVRQKLSGFIGLSPSHALAYRQEDFACFNKLYTVLVYGEKDDLAGQEAHRRFRLVPSARVIPVRAAGHLHFLRRPDIVNDVIIDALKALED